MELPIDSMVICHSYLDADQRVGQFPACAMFGCQKVPIAALVFFFRAVEAMRRIETKCSLLESQLGIAQKEAGTVNMHQAFWSFFSRAWCPSDRNIFLIYG